MAYDLEEQERIDELRHWWQKNRAWILSLIVIALAGVIGRFAYLEWKRSTADKAATAYADIEKAVTANDGKKVSELATKLASEFPKSFDASRAGLQAAKLAFEANDLATAKKHLEWVAASGVPQHRGLAAVRLAVVQLDEKKFDDALKTLDGISDKGYAPLVSETRGDVLVAAGRVEEARVAYKAAIDTAGERNPVKQSAQTKFDAVGGVAPPPSPVGAPTGTGIKATTPAPTAAPAPAPAPTSITAPVTVSPSGAPVAPAIAVTPSGTATQVPEAQKPAAPAPEPKK
jgi:predicted negative regulator of RcsB-dependent stress response